MPKQGIKIKIIFYFCYVLISCLNTTKAVNFHFLKNSVTVKWILILLLSQPFIAHSTEYIERTGRGSTIHIIDSLNKTASCSVALSPTPNKNAAEEALILSAGIRYTKGEAEALITLSKYYLIHEDYIKVLETYYKLIDLYEQANDNDNVVASYARVVQLFILLKDYELAKKYLDIASKLAKKSANPLTNSQSYVIRAKYYYSKGEYDSTIFNMYLCFPYFQKIKDPFYEGGIYRVIGDAFNQKKMYRMADYNYRQALARYSKIDEQAEIAITYTRLAHIYQVLNNHRLNLECNLAALRIREKTGNSFFIASSCLNVGEAYWLLNRKDSARKYLTKSLQIAELIHKTELLKAIFSQLAEFSKKEGNYKAALNYTRLATDHMFKMNLDRNRSEILIMAANRTIRASESSNDLLNQELLFRNLQIRNERIKIIVFEITLLTILALILVINTFVRKNSKRKNELDQLNKRLSHEIQIRKEAEERLARSEELHRFLAESIVDVISLLDENLKRLHISPSCEKFYGYTQREILQMKSPLELIDPEYHEIVSAHLSEAFRTKSPSLYVYKARKKDHTTFWAEANINPIIYPESGEIRRVITIVRDISQRVDHEEKLSENARQKEYLLHEIHNRVKNNFAILVSLMNMQREQSVNPGLSSSLTDLQLRVRTMSLVHEQLYHTQEISTIPFDNYLYNLAMIISSSFNNNRITLVTDIHPCQVAIAMALPLGLIINELITNAYKYAFPVERKGTIYIKLLPGTANRYVVSIEDDGIGLPSGFSMNNTNTMGAQIIRILVEQIEAIFEVSTKDRTRFQISFSTSEEL